MNSLFGVEFLQGFKMNIYSFQSFQPVNDWCVSAIQKFSDNIPTSIKLQISNKRSIHSPAEKKPELCDQALAVSYN